MSAWLVLLGAAASVCLAGCELGPDYHAPDIAAPKGFVAASATAAPPAGADSTKDAAVIDAARWWRALKDPELDSLIDHAVAANPDIEIALTRMQEARTAEAVVTGEALPELDASAGAGRGTGSDLARGRAGGPLVAAENTGHLTHVTQIAGFEAGWEIDLFGKFRRQIEAAGYQTEAAIAARNSVLIAVIADVARAYVDMRGLQMQLAVLDKNIDVARQYLDLVQQRFDRGITNELDLALAKRQFAQLQSNRMPLTAQIAAAQYVIAVLLGEFPEDMPKELTTPALIPRLPEKIQVGLPLEVLRRRPDIQEAERELAAATARVGVATADLFPHVVLTAGLGDQGQGLGVSPAVNNFIWSVGPSINWSLLDFGTLDALVEIADLRTHELLIGYKQAILGAIREVNSSLSTFAGQQDRLHNLEAALTASERAVSLATQRYDRGLTDALNVVDAERQEYELEEQYASSEQTAAEQFVALYRALGGGWEHYQSFPPIRQPRPAVLAAFERLLAPATAQK